ncbi:hypothetical protein B7463_g12662, partial [Scytalidium lignicola]
MGVYDAKYPSHDQEWDPIKVLGILNHDDGYSSMICIGYAPTKKRRCQNHTTPCNRPFIMRTLDELSKLPLDSPLVKSKLEAIASPMLCIRDHQDQKAVVLEEWYSAIRNLNSKSKKSSKSHPSPQNNFSEKNNRTDGTQYKQGGNKNTSDEYQRLYNLYQKILAERKRWEEEQQRRREQQQKEKEQKAREEAERKAKQEKEHKEKEEKERKEREEQERKEKAKRQPSEKNWEESWAEYQSRWATFKDKTSTTSTSNIRDSIPWPVKSGHYKDVTRPEVLRFYQNSPELTGKPKEVVVKFLLKECLNWHPDKGCALFKGEPLSEADRNILTMIAAVLNHLTARFFEEHPEARDVIATAVRDGAHPRPLVTPVPTPYNTNTTIEEAAILLPSQDITYEDPGPRWQVADFSISQHVAQDAVDYCNQTDYHKDHSGEIYDQSILAAPQELGGDVCVSSSALIQDTNNVESQQAGGSYQHLSNLSDRDTLLSSRLFEPSTTSPE